MADNVKSEALALIIDARVRERAATSIPTPTDAKGESK